MSKPNAISYSPAITNLVEDWRQRLIPEWKIHLVAYPITLLDDPDADVEEIVGPHGYQGQSKPTRDYLTHRVWLNLEHSDSSGRELEETIVHELLHAALVDLETSFDSVTWDSVSPQMLRLMEQDRRTDLERVIERLSRAIVQARYDDTELTRTS